MEQNESNLSFDQLPKAVGELLTKVDYVISRLDEKKEADDSSPTPDDDQMMTMDEACQSIGKKRSTMYSLTSLVTAYDRERKVCECHSFCRTLPPDCIRYTQVESANSNN